MTPERPQHVNPGMDTTIDPVFTPDTYREKPGNQEEMYLISESEWAHIDSLFQALIWAGKDYKESRANWAKIRTRITVAQQAPSDICMDCDGDPVTCREDPSKCQHDPIDVAALIAQEREKWERERAQQPSELIPDIQPIETFQNLMRTLNSHGETNVAVEVLKSHKRAKERDAVIAAQAREGVLKELKSMYIQAFGDPNVSEQEKLTLRMVDGWVESLRSEVKK